MHRHLITLLEWPAATWPAATAVVDGEQRFTYTQLRKRVFGLSEFFERRQLHGQRIALLESDLREMQGKPHEGDHNTRHGELDDARRG